MTRRAVWSVVLAGLGVAVVAAAVLVPVLGLRAVATRSATPGYVADARSAARSCAVDLMSLDYRTVDRDIDRLLDRSTGSLRSQYEKGREALRRATVTNHVRSTASVLSTALAKAGPSRVVVLLAMDSRIVDDSTPKGRVAHFRVRITVVPVHGRWLASAVTFVS